MAQADAAFGNCRQVGITHVAIECLLCVFDFNEDVALLLYDGDLVRHARIKQAFGEIVRLEVGAFQSGGIGHVAPRADIAGGVFVVREGSIADVIGLHMVKVHAHGRNFAQLVPLGDVFEVGCLAATGGLDVEDVHAVGFLIEASIVVFNLHVALEQVFGPQHHVVGIVSKLRAGGQFHAVGARGDGADFAVEEPLLGPVAGAVVGKDGLPVIVICPLEGGVLGGLSGLHSRCCGASGQKEAGG